ncbi:MAG: 50S ribosomal protein L22 [Deltaproteobacteria bacterium CG11_big_fil_rev_8_21_14_0_20_42_23]|nr:MAG: 50S ribosomal protein L22 [Deltaproteobacteria bacterium CG11_big_fil_rev_8_21_14_0_20_42_23]PJC64632.1 MAG: 50S ribosomal protein L22 [Deltaproteobacteria bacterium CG_4_9_14_0_2_um_filter_42_21]
MSVKASIKSVRMSPRKVRAVCDEIRGQKANWALNFLKHSQRRAAKPLVKLLGSALANADQKGGLDLDNLVISHLTCDQGPTMKRWMPRARGMATPVLKRTSQLNIVLAEK